MLIKKKKIVQSQKIKQLIFLFLILILIIIVIKNISKINLSLIITSWPISLMVIGLAICFIMIKSFMLFIIGKLFNLNKNYFHFVKVFCMSCFFEVTTFSGKLGADGFKYFFWKEIPKKIKISLLLFLRTADIFGFFCLFLFLLLPWELALTGIVITFLFTFINLKKSKISFSPESFKKTITNHWKLWVAISFLSAIAFSIMISQLIIIFNVLGLEITKKNASIFLISHGLGVLSQLPFGLGVKDFSIFYQLKEILSQSEIIFGLIWARLLGEMITMTGGAIFLLKKMKKR